MAICLPHVKSDCTLILHQAGQARCSFQLRQRIVLLQALAQQTAPTGELATAEEEPVELSALTQPAQPAPADEHEGAGMEEDNAPAAALPCGRAHPAH